MSAEDIERIRRGFELLERGELDEAFGDIHPDFELNDTIVLEDTTEKRGPEALRENFRQLRDAFDEIHYDLREFVDLGDRVLARVGAYMHAEQTGIEFNIEVGQIWTVRDGKAMRLDIYPSWEEAREAAGIES
jgi:ketosteroid isomerase-like protein